MREPPPSENPLLADIAWMSSGTAQTRSDGKILRTLSTSTMIGRVWTCRVAKIAAGTGRIYQSLCPKWQNSDIGPSQLDLRFRADNDSRDARKIMFDVVLDSEISVPDFMIVDEFLGGAAKNDAAGFHDVTSIGNRQCQIDVLFDQQHRHAVVADRC